MKAFNRVLNILFLAIIAAGLFVSVKMELVGRSLWFDEAALAWSFTQRSLSNLTSEGLELVQAAPVGWLYLMKIFTLIFGNTDYTLRIPSIIFYAATLVLIWYILDRIFTSRYALAGAAFAASLPIILQYSNVFKPYISDCFFVLLAVIIYHRYMSGRLPAYALGISFSILLWFSNPICFVEGGLIGATGLYALYKKDLKKFKDQVICCIPLGASFVIYYLYWLIKIDDGMNWFWHDYKFPFIPTSISDVKKMWQLTDHLFWQFYRWEYLALILVLIGFIITVITLIKKEDDERFSSELIFGFYLCFLLAFFASWIGKFPINKRMWLFLYPLVIIIMFVIFDRVAAALSDDLKKDIFGVFLLAFVLVNGGIRYYAHDENVYWKGYEVKAEMEYLSSIIGDENIYVFSAQRPMFAYYNDYDLTTLKGKGNKVMVGEHALGKGFDCEADLDYIINSGKCYVIMGDTWDEEAASGVLFDTLENEGTFTMVYDDYDTPLFYFEKKD